MVAPRPVATKDCPQCHNPQISIIIKGQEVSLLECASCGKPFSWCCVGAAYGEGRDFCKLCSKTRHCGA